MSAESSVRLTHEQTVRVELDPMGFGHSYIGDVDVSGVCQGILIDSQVANATKIVVRMHALPVEIEALGVVEIAGRALRVVHTYKGEGLTACGLEVVGPCPDCAGATQ